MSVMPISKITPETDDIPPLENGDSLDQETFHKRYRTMPANVRAELIGGIVYMPSPVGNIHAEEHALVVSWLSIYMAFTPGTKSADNLTVILGRDSEPQPDASLRLLNGTTKVVQLDATSYVSGPPEFLAEIGSSSESIDLHRKRNDYEKYGVGEYLCFLVRSRNVIWQIREEGKFVDLQPDSDGILRSRIFPGLWLDPAALLAGDLKRMIEVLNQGIATPEHAAFAAKLGSGAQK